jgi:hypothetical protein
MGTSCPATYGGFLQTKPDGSYEVSKIPPGRYFVVVNPYGPSDESPYGVKYYPATSRFFAYVKDFIPASRPRVLFS